MRKIIASIMILFIVSQSFLYSFSLAVTPWEGNSWSGNSWSGNTWSGNSWDGHSWEGQSFEGSSWESGSWEGQSIDGQNGSAGMGTSWQSVPWSLNAWIINSNSSTPGSVNGPNINGPSIGPGSSFEGNGPVVQNPVIPPNPYLTDKYSTGPLLSPLSPIGASTGTEVAAGETSAPVEASPFELPPWYDVTKYISKDIIFGQVDFATKALGSLEPGGDPFTITAASQLPRSILLNGIKIGIKDDQFVNFASDADAAFNAFMEGKKSFNTLYGDALGPNETGFDFNTRQNISQARSADDLTDILKIGSTAADTSKIFNSSNASLFTRLSDGFSKMGTLGKFNFATASVGAVYGGIETGVKTYNAIQTLNSDAPTTEKVSGFADAGVSLGETVMSIGAGIGAIPGFQAAGAGIALAGVAIFGVSRVTKFVADNWNGIKKFGQNFKNDPLKTTGEALSNGATYVKDKVTGGFEKTKSFIGGLFN